MTELIDQNITPRHFNPQPAERAGFRLRPVHAAAALALLAATFMIATLVLLTGSLMLGMPQWWLPVLAAAALCGAGAVWLTARFR